MPGSKSVTNRALVLAALAEAPGLIRGPLRSRDTLLMAAGLRSLGVAVDDEVDDRGVGWRVTPARLRGQAEIEVGNAGTVMRFLVAVAALADGPVRFDGDTRARERPITPLLSALRELGVEVDDEGRGRLPLIVRGLGAQGVSGGRVEVDASTSSQFVSALLLAGASFRDGVTVANTGAPLPSLPHVTMTVRMLRAAGARVDDGTPGQWRVAPSPLQGQELTVEPDLSNAAPFLAAALVTGGRVTVRDWPQRTTQAGDAIRELFTRMGGRCDFGPEGLTLTGDGEVRGIDVDLHHVGELTPVVTAVAALARTPSSLRGIGHLRGHETDRLTALAKEINGLGGDVEDITDRKSVV